jgi:hypothetical protein
MVIGEKMEKKSKVRLTNEEIRGKFKSSFDLVNYAIKLAENMIYTGRDARVKSEVQNRAMLILEEINEGKDQFDEIALAKAATENDLNGTSISQLFAYEESNKRKYRTAEIFEGEE